MAAVASSGSFRVAGAFCAPVAVWFVRSSVFRSMYSYVSCPALNVECVCLDRRRGGAVGVVRLGLVAVVAFAGLLRLW